MTPTTNHTRGPKLRGTRAIVALAILGGMLAAPTPSVQASHVPGEPFFDLGALPAPDYTGAQIFEGLKQFVAA